jgi:uncharacterized protein (TIGR00369 family)
MSSTKNRGTPRIHTVTWEDPRISARDAGSLSGLDYLRAIKEGNISPPPIAMLIGYRISEIEAGRAVFELEPAEYHYNPFATVHGGIACTLLDTTMTASVLSTLPIGVSCSTLDIKVTFFRAITVDTGTVRCEAKILHSGNRITTAEATLMDDQGKSYAHAVGTCMIFRAPNKK